MVKYVSPEGSLDVRNRNGSESEGLGFNLCVAPSRVIVSLITKDRGQIGGQRCLRRNDKSRTRTTRSFQSRGARRGLRRIMLREDYVEDKSIFELEKHTGVCTTYIA